MTHPLPLTAWTSRSVRWAQCCQDSAIVFSLLRHDSTGSRRHLIRPHQTRIRRWLRSSIKENHNIRHTQAFIIIENFIHFRLQAKLTTIQFIRKLITRLRWASFSHSVRVIRAIICRRISQSFAWARMDSYARPFGYNLLWGKRKRIVCSPCNRTRSPWVCELHDRSWSPDIPNHCRSCSTCHS